MRAVRYEADIQSIGSSLFKEGLWAFLFSTAAVWIISTVLIRILRKAFEVTAKRQGKAQETALMYVYRTLRFIICAIGVFVVLSQITPLQAMGSTLLGATSVLAVITGLAAQETFGNYISGFFLAVYQPFHIGDLITIPEKNITGVVIDMTFRHTVIRTYNQTQMIIPNGTLNTMIIEDLSGPYYSNWIEVQIAYDADVEKAKNIIENICEACEGCLDQRSDIERENDVPYVNVRLSAFGDSGVTLRFAVTSRSPLENANACSEIREQILKRFAEEGIEIPYPVRTVVVKKEEN